MTQLTHFTREQVSKSEIVYRNLADTMQMHITPAGIVLRGNWLNADGNQVAETPELMRQAVADHRAFTHPPPQVEEPKPARTAEK